MTRINFVNIWRINALQIIDLANVLPALEQFEIVISVHNTLYDEVSWCKYYSHIELCIFFKKNIYHFIFTLCNMSKMRIGLALLLCLLSLKGNMFTES